MQKQKKRNIILPLIIIVVILIALIVSILNKKNLENALETLGKELTNTIESTTKTQQTEYNQGEEAILGKGAITVTDVKRSQGNKWSKPQTGKEFIIITVHIENKGNSNLAYNPFDFKLQNSQGQQETMTFSTIDSDTSLTSGDLIPGGKVSGTIAFETIKNDNNLALIYSDSMWSLKELKINLK